MAQLERRKSTTVRVGNVRVGSSAPVVVQSMTNTDTADVRGRSSRLPLWPPQGRSWCG